MPNAAGKRRLIVVVLLGLFGGVAFWIFSALATLDNWSAQLAIVDSAMVKDELASAEQVLSRVEKESAKPSWSALPILADRLTVFRLRSRGQRKELSEAHSLAAGSKVWEVQLADSDRALRKADFARAEQSLSEAEAKLAAAPATLRLPILSERLNGLRQRAKAERKKLDDARRLYTNEIRSVLEAIRSQLDKGNNAAAVALINQAQAANTSPDAVLDSLTAFVNRHAKARAPLGAQLVQLTERMLQDCVAWKSARLANDTAGYVAFLKQNPQSPFAEEAKARLVDLEVAEIRKGNPGALPRATEVSAVRGRTYSVVNVHNNTPYELTLRYSGPDSFMTVLARNEKASIEMLVGKYSVAASVNATNVRNYAGDTTATGGDFEVTYYIQSGNLPYMIPPMGGVIYSFQQWPSKRVLPPYLK